MTESELLALIAYIQATFPQARFRVRVLGNGEHVLQFGRNRAAFFIWNAEDWQQHALHPAVVKAA